MNDDFDVLTVFVPKTHCEAVKSALFSVGAGQIGDYTRCCWQVLGIGQFQPSVDAEPTIGKANQIERVAEVRLELLCCRGRLPVILDQLHRSHPYETPAYWVTQTTHCTVSPNEEI